MYKNWFGRAHSPTTLKSVIFPQQPPEIDNLFDGHEFAICPRRIESGAFKKVDNFMWVAKLAKIGWINDYPFTIVIDWGAISKEMIKIVSNTFPDGLADIIVLYASPLSVFVQDDVPSRKKWNKKNNKWFLGEQSHVEERSDTKTGIATKLLEISQIDIRCQQLFEALSDRKKLYECMPALMRLYHIEPLNLSFRKYLTELANHEGFQHWFHENCPLDNF
jgi:hypothetical protein